MKVLTFLAIAAIAIADTSVYAANFEPFLRCDGGSADLMVNVTDRARLQLVIHDPNTITYLQGFISYGQTDMIIAGDTRYGINFSAPTGPKIFRTSGQSVLSSKDFLYFIDNTSLSNLNQTLVGSIISVYRDGTGLRVDYLTLEPKGCAGKIVTTTDCGGEGGGYCPHSYCEGSEYTTLKVLKNWDFHECH